MVMNLFAQRSSNCRFIALILLAVTALAPQRVQAVDRDVLFVIETAQYGLIGGTVLGLASLPMTHNARTIFIGSSIGLYLGIAAGLYLIFDREPSGGDPFNAPRGPGMPYPEDNGYDERRDESMITRSESALRQVAALRLMSPFESLSAQSELRNGLHAQVTVLKF